MMFPVHILVGICSLHLGFILTHTKKGQLRWKKIPEYSWLIIGISIAFFSHAIIDTIGTMYTYHEASPTGPLFSTTVYYLWTLLSMYLIYFALNEDFRYIYGIVAALFFDIWDHFVLRVISCSIDGYPEGCMNLYANRFSYLQIHNLEWEILYFTFNGMKRYNHNKFFLIVEVLILLFLIYLYRIFRIKNPIQT